LEASRGDEIVPLETGWRGLFSRNKAEEVRGGQPALQPGKVQHAAVVNCSIGIGKRIYLDWPSGGD
jgi:hypothetical protein